MTQFKWFRTATGVPQSLFDHMLTFLEPHRHRFKSLDLDEVLTLLLVHLRHGDSFNFLHASFNRVRYTRPVKLETISKCIRKALIILVGPNNYLKETQLRFVQNASDDEADSDDNLQEQHRNIKTAKQIGENNAKNCYYAGSSFDGLREGSNIGQFYNSHVGWFAQDMDVSINEGTSWFDLGIQRPSSQNQVCYSKDFLFLFFWFFFIWAFFGSLI